MTGTSGSFLRHVEDEHRTIMFFTGYQGKDHVKDNDVVEKLAIFGADRGRIGSKVKVLAAIESKLPGHGTKDMEVCTTPLGMDR